MIVINGTAIEGPDSNVTLPPDIQATIDRGNAAFNNNLSGHACPSTKVKAPAITAIIDLDDQVRRESRLKAKTQRVTGRRGQPPMTDRLRAVAIYVDHVEAGGVPFATARNSRMNKEIRRWLNGLMAKSKDKRKSRRKLITADTVRILLRQVAELQLKLLQLPIGQFLVSDVGPDHRLVPAHGRDNNDLSHAVSLECEAVSIVDEPIEDGVSDGGVDDLAPNFDWHLPGDDGRSALVAIIDDFEEIAPLLAGKRSEAAIIEDEKMDVP